MVRWRGVQVEEFAYHKKDSQPRSRKGKAMGRIARPLSLRKASEMFAIPIERLRDMIANGVCFQGELDGTILCDYDTKMKLYHLKKATPKKKKKDQGE
jgi:hypothetical protein